MCSIAGFSFTQKSRFNARKLASALLVAGEVRGKHATGFAQFMTDGTIDGNALDVRAAKFVSMPNFNLTFDAKSVILHTRYATQGRPENNLNNHPIYAYEGADQVAAVHNGCIDNDWALFRDYADKGVTRWAQVDSEIIPALIALKGSAAYGDVLGEIRGSIATAWLDERTPGVLHVARASDSPVEVAYVDEPRRVSRRGNKRPRLEGVVFASTVDMLERGLSTLGLSLNGRYVKHYQLDEGQYMSVTNGQWDKTVSAFKPAQRLSYRSWDDGWHYPSTNKRSQTFTGSEGWGGWSDTDAEVKTVLGPTNPQSRYYAGGTYTRHESTAPKGKHYSEGSKDGRVFISHNGYLEEFDSPYSDDDAALDAKSRNEAYQAQLRGEALEYISDELSDEERDEPRFSVTSHDGSQNKMLSFNDVLSLRDRGEITESDSELFMHLDFCETDYCVLMSPDECPVVCGFSTPSHGGSVRENIMNMSDSEISLVCQRMLADTEPWD